MFFFFAEVKTWMDKTLAVCRADGFVSTLLGRRRFLPHITSMLQAESAQAERQAINTCIQASFTHIYQSELGHTTEMFEYFQLLKSFSTYSACIINIVYDNLCFRTVFMENFVIVLTIRYFATSLRLFLRKIKRILQGSAAELFKIALLNLQKNLLGQFLFFVLRCIYYNEKIIARSKNAI